jgi:transposase
MERSTIHLLHKRGKSQREIASELGRSRSAVARALSEPVNQQPSGRRRKSSVDPFREQIAEWLKLGLSGVRMMELARDDREHPYVGGSSVWRAAVRRERLSLWCGGSYVPDRSLAPRHADGERECRVAGKWSTRDYLGNGRPRRRLVDHQ